MTSLLPFPPHSPHPAFSPVDYNPPSRAAGYVRIAGSGVQCAMGMIFTGIGVFFLLDGLGIISFGKIVAPLWVLDVVSLTFILFGIALFVHVGASSATHPQLSRSGKYQIILPEERPAKLFISWMVTLIWNAFVVIFWSLVLSGLNLGEDKHVIYFVLAVFTPFGLVFLYSSVKTTMGTMRFGLMPLQLELGPEGRDRTLNARLQIPSLKVLTVINTELSCYKLRWEPYRDAKGRSDISQLQEEIWHSDTAPVPVTPGTYADIAIPIAADLPGTTSTLEANAATTQLNRDYYAWILKVTADVPGANLSRSYEVPVPAAAVKLHFNPARPDPADVLEKTTAVHTVAEAQFAAGISADSITNKLINQGIAPEIVHAGIQQIADNPASPHQGLAQKWIAQQNKIQADINQGDIMMLRRPSQPGK